MSDLISRKAILDKFKSICENCGEYKKYNGIMCGSCYLDDAISIVEDMPTAEKNGKWMETKEKNIYKCSYCGNILDFDGLNAGRGDANYCPNCGKKLVW